MSQEDNLFSVDAEFEEIESEPTEGAEDIPALNGICHQCLGTDFVHVARSGVMGVLYTSAGQDAEGKERKRLVSCSHGQSYGI